MSQDIPTQTDDWILEEAPRSDIVISSRARLARNLPKFPFSPRAKKDQLAQIAGAIREALESSEYFTNYRRFELSKLPSLERHFLRESHLISTDLEKGREWCEVYLSEGAQTSIMVNEEDHLRIQTLAAGLQIDKVYGQIREIEGALEGVLEFAYNPQFGYLTACPTNTGTGLRVSVMQHLVGLSMSGQIEDAIGSLGDLGLVVRGAYGEHSTHTGDLFQISNEVTLGKTEDDLAEVLQQVIVQIIERETQAREVLFRDARSKCEDAVGRAIGLMSHAKSIDSSEAITLLSRLRLGLGRDFGLDLTHEQLNRLLIEVQPAHLRRRSREIGSTEEGDTARATLLRTVLKNGNGENRN